MWNNLTNRVAKLWSTRNDESRREDTDNDNKTTDKNAVSTRKVTEFLKQNPDFLEAHVMKEVNLDQIELWIIRRSQREQKEMRSLESDFGRKRSLSRWKFCVHADKRQMLQDLTSSLQMKPTKVHVLWELANCISSAVNADGFNLYIIENNDPKNLALYVGLNPNGTPKLQRITEETGGGGGISADVAFHVAETREPTRLTKNHPHPLFPNAIPKRAEFDHLLCQAIVQPDGQLIAVIELLRRPEGSPFHEEDEEISCSYIVWGGIALHYAHLFLNMNRQKKLNDFLLAVVKSIFQDMVSMDILVMKIMNFAQRLVDADRASLFLVDSRSKELYATIFDVGNKKEKTLETNSETNNGAQGSKEARMEIRFPIGTGIAGQVAMTGEILNISDAYSDPRFNRSIDQQTGYKTKSILCMPIFIRGTVIGVMQMVNKLNGAFNKEDEESFETFAVYCGLALHHAKLYDKIKKSEQKYKVALEVLSYHNSSTEEEVQQFLETKQSEYYPLLDDYYFNPFNYDDMEKVKFSIFMFITLFGLRKFDKNSLTKFTLTVKKNYRKLPYHNWSHGFSVANTMYTIIKKAPNTFRPIESLALYIASLCHDLDHRGKNNKFMLETESPLAAIYSTSTMEHHHFNQTVTILQQEGHNIFAKLTNSEYKQVLGAIKHCILATDLALFFPNRAKLTAIIEEEKFSWSISEHRLLVQAIAMTAADLSASAKPWDIQERTVQGIFEEFYEQGDIEKSAGRVPIPMMDRDRPEEQASTQVGFINGICIPCYSLLHRLVPETKPLLDKCEKNLQLWKNIAESSNNENN